MGALVNARRGGRSSPLLIGAFITCIIFLGFNYWLSNSRNKELQTKLYELEAEVRRASVERGAVELKKNEFQEELRRQNKLIGHIEAQHNNKLGEATAAWRQEKTKGRRMYSEILENLLFNISSSTKTIQSMKSQFITLLENLDKLQKESQDCQRNISTLDKKLSNDLTQCKSRLMALEEECMAKVVAPRPEAAEAVKKAPPPQDRLQASPGLTKSKMIKGAQQGLVEKTDRQIDVQVSKQTKPNPTELDTNHIADQDASQSEKGTITYDKPAPARPEDKAKDRTPQEDVVGVELEKNGPKTNDTETNKLQVLDTHTVDLTSDDVENGRMNEEDEGEYNEVEPGAGRRDTDAQLPGNTGEEPGHLEQEMEEMLADYDGNDDNEGEFEADKQAALFEVTDG
ncbi:Golgi membrane protein 1 [Brienomyrus brachyistius]|uniref:Golgi membrane protein 1 n=1 Tax=Brienomyrus brachyistius TaxID=42636 RepID=UPI0020B3F49F|nr:Golgi membrane protein 1 [Brienomyrus brachyistius]